MAIHAARKSESVDCRAALAMTGFEGVRRLQNLARSSKQRRIASAVFVNKTIGALDRHSSVSSTDTVIARSVATWQSMRPGSPKAWIAALRSQ